MYTLYILRNIHNRLYIRQTNNIKRRLNEHKNHYGAKYTKDYGDFKLVYTETFNNRTDAMRREAQLKRWTIAKKEALICGDLALLKKL